MATNILGVRNNNTIVSYSAATKRTTQVDLTVTANGTALTSYTATGRAYADSAGKWRLDFNIEGAISSPDANDDYVITGVTFKSGKDQGFTVQQDDSSSIYPISAVARASGSVLSWRFSSAISTIKMFGDVELDSKPTWADANMEGVTAVDVLIPEANATTTGLVNTSAQTIAGVKTFSGGIILPTSDPHVVGAIWNSSGTLTISAG